MMSQSPTDYTGDVDVILNSGSYKLSPAATNSPSAHYYSLLVFGNELGVVGQLAIRYDTGEIYNRARTEASGWTTWKQIDGALDAEDYASSSVGGTVKMGVEGTVFFVTNDGSAASS